MKWQIESQVKSSRYNQVKVASLSKYTCKLCRQSNIVAFGYLQFIKCAMYA